MLFSTLRKNLAVFETESLKLKYYFIVHHNSMQFPGILNKDIPNYTDADYWVIVADEVEVDDLNIHSQGQLFWQN